MRISIHTLDAARGDIDPTRMPDCRISANFLSPHHEKPPPLMNLILEELAPVLANWLAQGGESAQPLLASPSNFHHLGITVLCLGREAQFVFLWCQPDRVTSLLDLPKTVFAQITADDLQPLLDLAIDLCPEAMLTEAIGQAKRASSTLQAAEKEQREKLEHHKREWRSWFSQDPLPEPTPQEEAARQLTLKLENDYEASRVASNQTTAWLFFLRSLLRRREVLEEDRQQGLRIREDRRSSFGPPAPISR